MRMPSSRWWIASCSLAVLLASSSLVGQDPAKKTPQEPKTKEPSEPTPGKARGILPAYWREIGLTESQKQEIYKIQGKYNQQIEELEAKIKSLKEKMSEERFKVLSEEQKKNLEKLIRAKAGGKGD